MRECLSACPCQSPSSSYSSINYRRPSEPRSLAAAEAVRGDGLPVRSFDAQSGDFTVYERLSNRSTIRYDTIRDTIRDAISTCAQKLTRVSLICRTEPTTKKRKNRKKLKSKKTDMFRFSEVSVNSPGNPWSQS